MVGSEGKEQYPLQPPPVRAAFKCTFRPLHVQHHLILDFASTAYIPAFFFSCPRTGTANSFGEIC
jgi:hypothetical protein